MKAEINGVKLEGTPEEIAKAVELMKPTPKATAAPAPTMEDLRREMQEYEAQKRKSLQGTPNYLLPTSPYWSIVPMQSYGYGITK